MWAATRHRLSPVVGGHSADHNDVFSVAGSWPRACPAPHVYSIKEAIRQRSAALNDTSTDIVYIGRVTWAHEVQTAGKAALTFSYNTWETPNAAHR
jgi:hypothetical protein